MRQVQRAAAATATADAVIAQINERKSRYATVVSKQRATILTRSLYCTQEANRLLALWQQSASDINS